MKKQVPILLFFAIFFSLKPLVAQIDFAPVGAKWWHEYWVLEPFNNFYTYESVGDTILGGQNARIIEFTSRIYMQPPNPIPEATIYLTSDEDRIYSWIRDSFYLLYDFSAQVGDTLHIGANPVSGYYGGALSIQVEDSSKVNFFRVVVDSVYMTTINNESFRSYTVLPAPNHPDFIEGSFGNYQRPEDNTINEKLGFYGIGSPLGNISVSLAAGNPGRMRCYYEPSFAYPSSDTTYCNPYVFMKSIEERAAFDFQLFPNPNQDGLLFLEGISAGQRLQIIDFSGRLLLDQRVDHPSEKLSLDIGFLENGIYWLKVQSKDGFGVTKKIMVLRN